MIALSKKGMIMGKTENRCNSCGSIYVFHDFNFQSYYCYDCGNIWFESGHELTECDLEEIKDRENRKKDNEKFSDKIRRQDVMAMFSPSNRYLKYLESLITNTVRYHLDLYRQLTNGASYYEIKSYKGPYMVSENDFYLFIRDYLCSRDELPFYPSIDEWSSYLGCPNEELVNIDKPDLLFSMMYMNPVKIISEVFNFVFYGKIRNAIHKIDTEYRMELEKHGSLDFCLDHYYENEGQESFVEQYLSEEKRVIDRFLFAAKQKKKEFYMKAKEDHLSIIDTMMLFVDYSFEEYPEYWNC